MKIQPILNEEFYAWIAPNGEVQIATMAQTEILCIAFAKMMHKQGVGQSPHEMKLKGFSIQKIKLTVLSTDLPN